MGGLNWPVTDFGMYSQRPFKWYMTRLSKLKISWRRGKQYTSSVTLGGGEGHDYLKRQSVRELQQHHRTECWTLEKKYIYIFQKLSKILKNCLRCVLKKISIMNSPRRPLFSEINIYIYIYIYMCVCVCVLKSWEYLCIAEVKKN